MSKWPNMLWVISLQELNHSFKFEILFEHLYWNVVYIQDSNKNEDKLWM